MHTHCLCSSGSSAASSSLLLLLHRHRHHHAAVLARLDLRPVLPCQPSCQPALRYPQSFPLAGSAMSGNCLGSTRLDEGTPVVDKAVIVGGGLGGLAAALQLREIGIDAHVYEKSPRISGGQGTLISLFPNGCKALNEADPEVVRQMRYSGMTDVVSSILTPNGLQIGEWSLSTQMEKRYGQPMICIMWWDALRILSEALPGHCIHTGYECIDVFQDDGGAIVHFRNNNETHSVMTPLVIGADGIHSVVRTALFGEIPPRDNGRTMWRAVIDSSVCSHKALITGCLATQSNGHTIFIVNGVQGKLYWAYSVEDTCCDGSTKFRSKDQKEMKERILEYFKGWDLAIDVVQVTEPDLILERRVLDMPVLPTWSKGNAVILGDAAHAITPALGQGANMAYEDGLQLANALVSSSDLRSALQMYEDVRIPRTRKISEKSQSRNVQASDEFYDWLYNDGPTKQFPKV